MAVTRPEVRAAFVLLLSAREAAALGGASRGEVTLPEAVLTQAGLSPGQIAALCRGGWLRESGGGYVLTAEGARQACPAAGGAVPGAGGGPRPCWDRRRGELRLGEAVVKRLPATATAQVAVLEAFQQAGWPEEIEVAPAGRKTHQPKLREAVRNLNRSRLARGLTFWLRRGRLGWSAT
jgi:hypothetical protein